MATDIDVLSAKSLVLVVAVYAGVRLWASLAGGDHIEASLLGVALGPHARRLNPGMSVVGDYFSAGIQLVHEQIREFVPAILVLVLGIGLLLRLRGRRHPGRSSAARVCGTWLHPAMCRMLVVADWSGRILWPFAAVLVTVNVLALAFFIQRNLSLSGQPNVVIIMADTVRADHLGCYGYSRNTSSNLDRLAHDGIRFENAISQAPFTRWSVSSFMSSSYPDSRIPEGVTIQEFLADRGYTTCGIVSNLWNYVKDSERHRRFDYWDSSPSQYGASISSPAVLSSARKWLKKVEDRKFFMFVLFADPHSPYIKHKDYDFDPKYHGDLADSVPVSMKNTRPSTPAPCDLEHMNAVYDSEIAYTDAHIGELINRLKKKGLYDKTLIVFLSDHGEEFRDHGAFFHTHTLYRELLQVPVIVKLPGHHESKIVRGSFPLIDLFPSIVRQLGYGPEKLGLFGEPVNLQAVKHLQDKTIFSANSLKRSVCNSTYKLIITLPTPASKEMIELYLVDRDKNELVSISSQLSDVVKRLRRIMLNHDQQIGFSAENSVKQQDDIKSEGDARRMKALGYLQ